MILINSSPKNALKIFQPFLPIYVPIGVGCLLAATEKEGIKAHFIDEQIENNILDKISAYTERMQSPYIFGFSVLTPAFRSSIKLSRTLKKIYPKSIIIFGGVHPSAMPDEVLSYAHIDYVIRGEADRSLIEFYRSIKENRSVRHIKGLSYRDKEKIVHNERPLPIDKIDELPAFPYHLFTAKEYDLGFIASSRGCPYQCIFCSNRITTGKKYRYRSADTIVSELELLYYKYKKSFVIFLDDNFCVSKGRVYEVIEAIRNKGLYKKMTFSFQSRGDNVDYKLLKDLFDSGFKSIFFGLETSSERIMKIIKKGETVAQCVEAARMAEEIGFYVSATFIYGLPTETHRDRMNCVDIARELRLDMVRYNNATPYPGTELYNIAKDENRLNIKGLYDNFCSVSTFIENPLRKIPLSYIPEGNTEEQMRMDILFSYFSFYININRLKTIFTNPNQGAGWFNAGEKIGKIAKRIPALTFLGFILFLKFFELFYYMVIKKQTRTSFPEFSKVFSQLI